jgi:hypothetical protein
VGIVCLALALSVGTAAPQAMSESDELTVLLERLRAENAGEQEKVKRLAETNRAAALEFLRERFGPPKYAGVEGDKPAPPAGGGRKKPVSAGGASGKQPLPVEPLPARIERFQVVETLDVGEFSIELCRRADGAFGLGQVRRGDLPLRRSDSLITWQVDGQAPAFDRREGSTVTLRDPAATLAFTAEQRASAATGFSGFRIEFRTDHGPIVETASWELGGSTHGLSYFDGYRGWHAAPDWVPADAVPPPNPKLVPSLLHGTGFQFQHGSAGALVHFHTAAGDAVRNASRGEALEFETTFHGPTTIDRYVFVTSRARQASDVANRGGADPDSRINLWTRAYEVVHAELRRAFDLPERSREMWLQWPPFSRQGFRETARECATVTAREGFTGASIDVIWDNADAHGGAKNMNVWDYSVCAEYGGAEGLQDLVDECRRHNLLILAWTPSGHLWDASPVWRDHPDWLLRRADGSVAATPTGPVFGDLAGGFHDYYRERIVGAVRAFGLDGLWMDSHLPYAQQARTSDHAARLAALYRDFIRAGARHLIVEGDASALGAYGIGIGDDWQDAFGKIPEPDLYYGSTLLGWSTDPRVYVDHFRRFAAAGALWVVNWDFLYSGKLAGAEFDAARREVRAVLSDYRQVRDRMVHRFVHADGSGYTWTNDDDAAQIVWLLRDALLRDGRRGEVGRVYVLEAD